MPLKWLTYLLIYSFIYVTNKAEMHPSSLEWHSLERIPLPKLKNSKFNNLIVEKLKPLTTSHFAVAFHPLDGILNLCTKYEVPTFTKSKFMERVLKCKRTVT